MRLAALSLIALLGCSVTPTNLVVVIDSDLSVPDELSLLFVTVWSENGELAATNHFPLGSLPISFGIVPKTPEDQERSVTLAIEAQDPARKPLFVRRAETLFRPGERVKLPLFLARSCIGNTCREAETCTETGCAPPAIDPSTLTPIEPGEELGK